MKPNPTRPKGTAIAVWSVFGYFRTRVNVFAGVAPRQLLRYPYFLEERTR